MVKKYLLYLGTLVFIILCLGIPAGIGALAAESQIRAERGIVRAGGVPENSILLAAVYDDTDTLIGVSQCSGGGVLEIDIREEMREVIPKAKKMKAFLWDMSEQYPLCGRFSSEMSGLLSGAVSDFDLESGVNGNAPRVTLNSGYTIPAAGIGTYSLHGDVCVNSVKSALEQGVRLIDTASAYGNEEEVGRAVREFMEESGVDRSEIFVITKLYPGSDFAAPEAAIEEALAKLDIGYIDMMLLHHPGANDVKAYKAIEKYIADGRIHTAGLSNWYIEEIDDFISQVDIRPDLVQNEIHPYYQEKEVIPYMHSLGIAVQAWYPLGGRGHTQELLTDETIADIAEAHGKSPAQVILRWDLQNGVIVIPGSSDPEQIKENISLFDFELTDEEMARIAALDRNEKHDWY